MRRWKSPLKKGNIVVCEGGLVVEILEKPKWTWWHYDVSVLILQSEEYRVGIRKEFCHRGTNRFGESKFKEIFKSRKEWSPQGSLEEEFFQREKKHAS